MWVNVTGFAWSLRQSAASTHSTFPPAGWLWEAWNSTNSLPSTTFHCCNHRTWYGPKSNGGLNLLWANICRQWFWLFIQVCSTTVSLQGLCPVVSCTICITANSNIYSLSLAINEDNMIENHQQSPDQTLCIPAPLNLPGKSSTLAKLSGDPFCIWMLTIWSSFKCKTSSNYVLFSAIWGL